MLTYLAFCLWSTPAFCLFITYDNSVMRTANSLLSSSLFFFRLRRALCSSSPTIMECSTNALLSFMSYLSGCRTRIYCYFGSWCSDRLGFSSRCRFSSYFISRRSVVGLGVCAWMISRGIFIWWISGRPGLALLLLVPINR